MSDQAKTTFTTLEEALKFIDQEWAEMTAKQALIKQHLLELFSQMIQKP